MEKMTRNSNAHMRDGFLLAESDLVDFLSGSTDSAINFSGSADLHTPIHPPPTNKTHLWKPAPIVFKSLSRSDHLAVLVTPQVKAKPMRKIAYARDTREHRKIQIDCKLAEYVIGQKFQHIMM